MTDLAPLLEVQDLDTTLDQVRHRLATHPARQAIRQTETELSGLREQLAAQDAVRHDLLRQQRRWDDEVAKVAARRVEIDRSLYGGTVTSPKELVALQADAESLKRRQADLEDHELEVMEQVEAVTATVQELTASLEEAEGRLEARRQELTAATAELEIEAERISTAREAAARSLDADLLARYEDLRQELGGVAVARLHGTTCEGCHLSLSAVSMDHLRKLGPDELPLCEECGRILVR